MRRWMRMLTGPVIASAFWGCCAAPVQAEGCFRSPREAAAGAGVRDGEGFRLEGIRVDRLAGGQWATVRSCMHPERPGEMVKVDGGSGAQDSFGAAPAAVEAKGLQELPLVRAGQPVRVIRLEQSARLETAGIAQANAARGARVRVRLAGTPEGAAERFAEGTVRSEGVVELEAGR